ncbi:MAG: hypothetical protein ACK5KR_04110 [Breznakia sp.]
MNYYEDIKNQIQSHIDEGEVEEARFLLLQELRMPYVPKAYENIFNELWRQCETLLKDTTQAFFSEEQLHVLLQGNEQDVIQACEHLRSRNVRDFLDDIQMVLRNKIHPMIKTNLLEIMKQQQLHEEVVLLYEGMEISCIPSYMESIDENEYLPLAIKELEDCIANDNPSMYQMAVESLIKEAYYKLPISLSEDEIPYIVHAILRYVYEAFGETQQLECLLLEKDLAKYGGYDLLLYTYEV